MNQATDHEDIWHVQLPTGELRIFTLDQLDAAFQVGMIDESCYVRRDGSMKWRTLADELGSNPEVPAPQPQPQQYVSPTPSPVVTYQPIYSTAPMVSEIDLDELPAGFKKSSKGKIVGVVGGLTAVAALAVFGVTKLGGAAQGAAAAAGAAVTVATPVAAPPPADPTPSTQQNKLNDDQKKALADMDKANERKADERRKARIENAPKTSKPYKSEKPFSKSGNKYDPLNAKL